MSRRKVAGALTFLVDARGLQLEHETSSALAMLMLVLRYGNKIMIYKEERSRIRAEQMDDLRGLLVIRRMDKAPNAQIREMCGVMKGMDKRIDKWILCSEV